MEIEGERHAAAPDLEHVAEALGHQQRDARAAMLDDRIEADGGAMHQQADRIRREPGGCKQCGETLGHRARRIGGRARLLVVDERGQVRMEQHEIGEGAADVDADAGFARRLGHGSSSTITPSAGCQPITTAPPDGCDAAPDPRSACP